MGDHPNVKLIQRGFDAFAAGDMETLHELFSPGIKWHGGGHSTISGTYEGVDAVLGFFGRLVAETGGQISNEVHDILADDDHGVALVEGTTTRGGKTVVSQMTFVFHIAGGKVSECWTSAFDQAAADALWA